MNLTAVDLVILHCSEPIEPVAQPETIQRHKQRAFITSPQTEHSKRFKRISEDTRPNPTTLEKEGVMVARRTELLSTHVFLTHLFSCYEWSHISRLMLLENGLLSLKSNHTAGFVTQSSSSRR